MVGLAVLLISKQSHYLFDEFGHIPDSVCASSVMYEALSLTGTISFTHRLTFCIRDQFLIVTLSTSLKNKPIIKIWCDWLWLPVHSSREE